MQEPTTHAGEPPTVSRGSEIGAVKRLSLLAEDVRQRAGGKAAGLARMLELEGVRVPDGFVVLPEAATALPAVQEAILAEFDRLNTARVAVRSSGLKEDGAVDSCAGLFQTFLDVDRSALLERIDEVRQSALIVPGGEAQMTVVVQPMLPVQIGGVCFSMSPVGGSDELLVEAVEGLCETLVSGEVTPERYRISRKTLEIRNERSGGVNSGRAVLSPDLLRELTDVALRLEQAEGHAVDIEWALAFGVLHILQCRPITAAAGSAPASEGIYRYIWSTSEPLWMMELGLMTRARLLPEGYAAETVWDLDDIFYAKQGDLYEYYISEGNLARFRPKKSDTRRILRKAEEARLLQDKSFASMRDVSPPDLTSLGLASHFDRAARFYCEHIGLYSASSSLVTRALEEELRAVLPIEEQLTLMRTLEPDLMETEQSDWAGLVNKGRFTREIALEHVRQYPFIVLNLDSEAQIVATLESLYEEARSRLSAADAPDGQSRGALESEQARILGRHPELRETVTTLHRMSASRMQIKRGWAGLGFFLIPLFEEVARRCGEPVDELLAHYRFREMERLILTGERLDAATKRRRAIACLWHARDGKITFVDGEAASEAIDALTPTPGGGALHGFIASAGTARGRARIVHCNEPESTRLARGRFCDGDILVTEMAQPSMMDLIARSSAVVTDEGGLLSHAAIVTREHGIPCIVGTGTATKDLVDGEMIELLPTGEIVRIEDAAEA